MEEREALVTWATEFVEAHPVPEGGFDDPMLRTRYLDSMTRLTDAAHAADALGRPSDALPFLKPVCRLLLRLSRWTEAEPLLDYARELAERMTDSRELAAIWNEFSVLYHQTERKDAAAQADASALEAARVAGDDREVCVALLSLGARSVGDNRLLEGQTLLDEVLEIARRSGLLRQEAQTLMALAGLAELQGQPEQCRNRLEQAIELLTACGDKGQTLRAKSLLSVHLSRIGQRDEAVRLLTPLLETFDEVGNQRGKALALMQIGQAQRNLGRFSEAEASLRQSLAIRRETGSPRNLGYIGTLHSLGLTLHDRKAWTEARSVLREELVLRREIQDPVGEGICLGNLGFGYIRESNWSEAVPFCEEAVALLRLHGKPLDFAKTASNLIRAYGKTDRGVEARSVLEQAIQVSGVSADTTQVSMLWNSLSITEYRTKHYPEALAAAKNALEALGPEKDSENETVRTTRQEAWQTIGRANHSLSNWETAKEAYQKSVTFAAEKDDDTLGELHNWIGNVLRQQKRWLEAAEAHAQAWTHFHADGDTPAEATALFNFGTDFRDSKAPAPDTIAAFRRCARLRERTGDTEGEAMAWRNIGVLYRSEKNWEAAADAFSQAFDRSRKAGDSSSQARALNLLAGTYLAQGKWRSASGLYEESLRLDRPSDDRKAIMHTLGYLGAAYRVTGKYELAIERYEEALQIARDTGDASGEGWLLHRYGYLYARTGDYAAALRTVRSAIGKLEQAGEKDNVRSARETLAKLEAEATSPTRPLVLAMRRLVNGLVDYLVADAFPRHKRRSSASKS